VKRPLQSLLLLLSGLGLLHATLLTDLYLTYVKPGMRPLLIASGVLLLALAAAEARSLWRTSAGNDGGQEADSEPHAHEPGNDHDHSHDHSTPPRVAWLLFLPALSLLVYAPPAIGAYTAAREDAKVMAVKEQDDFEPLPKTSPLPMTLTDFTTRVQQDREQAIKGREIEMTGYVTPDRQGTGGGWYLTRTIFSCCAADAQFVKVRVHGTPSPPADTWVTITGTWHPEGTLGTKSARAALDVRTVEKTDRPSNGYTDALPLPGS
jgi:uncharacterized repeat protein (TIGR03943 family)